MSTETDPTETAPPTPPAPAPEQPQRSRFADLDELQQEVARRLLDNQKFLERFLDDDFPDEDTAEEGEEDDFEEL